jgi:hypothetical protein
LNPLTIRLWHSYVGLFTAPSVLFFALTGAVQVFSLHEAHGTYQPWGVVEKLSQVHKDQVYEFGGHHTAAPEPAPDPAAAKPPSADKEAKEDKPALPTTLLKSFFFVVGLALAASAVLGLWIGLTQTRSKPLAWVLVLLGVLLPVAFLIV